MTIVRHHGGWVIVLSFVVAFVLTVLPVPAWMEQVRPNWTALIVIYWTLALPQRVGVGVAWLAGLFQDVLIGTLLGTHALAFLLVAYLTLKLHQRIRVFPLWQQALSVLVLLLSVRLVLFWVNGFIGRPAPDWVFWAPAFVGTLIWPVIFVILREMRRRYHVQ